MSKNLGDSKMAEPMWLGYSMQVVYCNYFTPMKYKTDNCSKKGTDLDGVV